MKVGLFIPCYVDAFFPEVGIATLQLLERLGCSVEYPLDQTCCGQPMANSGCQPDAAPTETHFVHCFREFDTIVGPSGSCVHHVQFHLDAIEQTAEAKKVRDPHDLNDVDVGVVRSPLAVAEAGAVWLTQGELVVNDLGVLSQHFIVLLDPTAIVDTMHDAYGQLDLTASPYGVFLAGPSATGDIEGVIIHGAQGARSLTVLLLTPVPPR